MSQHSQIKQSKRTVSPLGTNVDLVGWNLVGPQVFADKLFTEAVGTSTVEPCRAVAWRQGKELVHDKIRLLLHEFDRPIISQNGVSVEINVPRAAKRRHSETKTRKCWFHCCRLIELNSWAILRSRCCLLYIQVGGSFYKKKICMQKKIENKWRHPGSF